MLDLIFRTKKIGTGGADAEKELSGVEKATTRLGAAAKAAAVAGVGLLVGGLTASVAAALEAEKIMAQTEAVIKATGGAAGLTAEEISNLAEAESRLTSIDDEVIQSGANMLLTFKEIGGETFPRATRAMEDMAVAMASGDTSAIDLTGTAIQLGKALNDPLKGLTALQKVGVTFAEEQKKAIKEMVRMNDVAGAQAVILAELESEFGGAAAAAGDTMAGKMQKAQNALENFGETIGNKIIPIIGDAADAFVTLITASDQLRAAFVEHQVDMKQKVIDGKVSLEEYNAEIIRAATLTGDYSETIGLTGQKHVEMSDAVDLLTEAELRSEQIVARLGDERAENIQAMFANQAAIAELRGVVEEELIPTEEELIQAEKDAAKAAEEHARALDKARDSASTAAEGFFGLAQTYAEGVKTMDTVKRALDAIDQAERNGIITDGERRTAQEQIMLQYGLTTEAGLIMASSEEELNRLLNAGFISATDYTGALVLIPKAAKDGRVSMDELGEGARNAAQKMGDAEQHAEQLRDRIAQLESKEITVTTIFQTVGHEEGVGGPGGRQFGGPVFAGEPVRVHPPELFFPQQSGFIMSQADTRELLGLLQTLVTRPGVINFNTTAPLNATRDSATIRALAGAF